MDFKISKSNQQKHFFEIELRLKAEADIVELQLPAWRPGRYELQNFSKNIQTFTVFDKKGLKVKFRKITKDKWEIMAKKQELFIKYSYYSIKTDAGNSYVDDSIFYVNFVNCIPYQVGKIETPVSVSIDIPSDWSIACALKFKKNKKGGQRVQAKSFYELYDSPLIACPTIDTKEYKIDKTQFKISVVGNYNANWPKILPAFEAFSKFQIMKMEDFPVQDYSFIIWVLPTAFYHGVEHCSSTMIVLGPDIEGDTLIADLLGVSSHELFHAWNICKIRPKELLKYDYTKENYFETGFIVEGVTTYLGDLILVQSGVISKDEYLKELSTVCIRHFVNDGKASQSLVESSIDLWVDGYGTGVPNKKVSIYHKGALVAFILDLMIRNKFNHERSLYTIMKEMWFNFGKKGVGYQLNDYKLIAESIFEGDLDEYFEKCIFGNDSLESLLNQELNKIGLELVWKNEASLVVSELEKQKKIQKNNLAKFLTDNEIVTI